MLQARLRDIELEYEVRGSGVPVVFIHAGLPGVVEQAVRDAGTFFDRELPALRGWTFGQAQAKRIEQPVLAVLGARSGEVGPAFGERHDLLLAWLPDVEPFVLPGGRLPASRSWSAGPRVRGARSA